MTLRKRIEERLNEIEIYVPNYCGRVPRDWEEVATSQQLPTSADVFAALDEAADVGGETIAELIDDAIVSLINLPDGYEGVAITVRTCPHIERERAKLNG